MAALVVEKSQTSLPSRVIIVNEYPVRKLYPVEPGGERPKWSVMIPTYNCAHYLRETLVSVLQQDPGPDIMQIEVIDDGSSDNPHEVVLALGGGRVGFFRQSQNVGHIQNFETALERSRGKLVHLLHGDDRVLPGFYKEMEELFDRDPSLGAGFCRHYFIDEAGDQGYISPVLQGHSGALQDFSSRIVRGNFLQTPSMVVRRDVYEQVGMFDRRLSSSEDWEMWTRIGHYFKVGWCRKPLAEYRVHTQNNTNRTDVSGKAYDDYQLIFRLLRERQRDAGLKKVHEALIGGYLVDTCKKLIARQEKAAARRLLRKGFRVTLPAAIQARLLKLYLKLLF